MDKLEKIYLKLKGMEKQEREAVVSPALPVITLLYLIAVLSVSLTAPQKLIWLAAYPIINGEIAGTGYLKILIDSLWLLPILIFIGIFNPIIDTKPAFYVGNVLISQGWVSFTSIILRGLLSFQALILMVEQIGFLDIFSLMRRIGVPKVMCQQLLLTYRYISVIIEEVIIMKRARASRGYGRKSYPLKFWGMFVGQLMVRSTERARRIHAAMLARGFNGVLPLGKNYKWSGRTLLHFLIWISFITFLRFFDFSNLIVNIR